MHSTDGTEWDKMREMMVITKQMRVINKNMMIMRHILKSTSRAGFDRQLMAISITDSITSR